MPSKYPHDIANDAWCANCGLLPSDCAECPAAMLAHIASLKLQVEAKSEWEASQHKLAARVRGEERAAVVQFLRYGKGALIEAAAVAWLLASDMIEAGKHHTTDPA